MKIVQIIDYSGDLLGLADDGELYVLIHENLGFGLHKPTWKKHCESYGPALHKTVLDQVADYIKNSCYTSTDLFKAVEQNYSNGAFVVDTTEKVLVMQSNDERVIVSVLKCTASVHVEDNVQVVQPAIKITTTNMRNGKVESALLINKSGGTYERVLYV